MQNSVIGKNLLKNKEMIFKNGVINIQAAGFNGASLVIKSYRLNEIVRNGSVWNRTPAKYERYLARK